MVYTEHSGDSVWFTQNIQVSAVLETVYSFFFFFFSSFSFSFFLFFSFCSSPSTSLQRPFCRPLAVFGTVPPTRPATLRAANLPATRLMKPFPVLTAFLLAHGRDSKLRGVAPSTFSWPFPALCWVSSCCWSCLPGLIRFGTRCLDFRHFIDFTVLDAATWSASETEDGGRWWGGGG